MQCNTITEEQVDSLMRAGKKHYEEWHAESASDYESDFDETMPVASRKEGEMIGEYAYRRDRIFKHIPVQDKNVRIPDLEDKGKLTLFMEIDDVLLHTFICDENFGYIANPIANTSGSGSF